MNRKQRRADKSSKGFTSSPEVAALQADAMKHHQAGRLAEAETLYRRILAIEPRHADSIHLIGLIGYQIGQYEVAAKIITEAIKINPKTAAYHNNLGLALHHLGRFDEAVASYGRALVLEPHDAELHNNLGVTLEKQGKTGDALAHYKKALGIRPDYASAHYNTGNAYRAQGDGEKAIASYQQALAVNPDYVEALNNLGTIFKDRKNYGEAASCFERALAVKPDHVESIVNIGNVFQELEKPEEALGYYDRAVAINPAYADAHNNRGLTLKDMGQYDDAIAACRRAVELVPGRAEILNNLGAAFEDKGDYAEAAAIYRQAQALDPRCAETYYNLGNLAKKEGRLDDALKHYAETIAIRPDYAEAHWNYAFILFLKGDLPAAWRESEWRWHRRNMKPHGYAGPLWDGGSLAGKTILLHCEQGLGDSIQFIRYAPLVKARGGQVLLVCPAPLAKLFATVGGIDRIFTEAKDLPAYDCQAPLLTLPGILRTTLENIPAAVPYLKPDAQRVVFWRERLSGVKGFKVGVVWRGNPKHKNDRNRSMTPALFAGFLDLPGLTVVNLQKDGRSEELAALGVKKDSFIDPAPELGNFEDTAALVSCLDLVISVDTSVCHLAGALGVPVWTMITFAPDWRWLLERADTPWYPSMRLFRQPQAGDWQSVVGHVRQALSKTA